MILVEDIYAKTNSGLDIILFFYPQARECLSGRQKHFRIREGDHTPSASMKELKGIWHVADFGDAGRAMSPIDICMQEKNLSFTESLFYLAREFNVDGKNITPEINKPDIRTRAATEDEPEGHFVFEENDRISDTELALLGPRVKEESCKALGWTSVKQYSITRNGKTTTIISTENYPVFMRKCRYPEGNGKSEAHFYKIYQPLNPDKAFRFFYHGTKPQKYVNGLIELEKTYRDYNRQRERDMINCGDLKENETYKYEKMPEAFICSGERDALCVHALGYHPLWFNSETYRLSPVEYNEIARYATRIYNIPDLDETGVRKAVALSMQYYDIHVVWLPDRLKEFRDNRGRPRKDFRDFCEIWPEKTRFQELLNLSMPFRLWEYRENKNGSRLEFITEYAIQFIKYSGYTWIADKRSPNERKLVHICENIVSEADMYHVRQSVRKFCQSHHLSLDIRELINNSSRFTPSMPEGVPHVDVNFCRHTPDTQFFFFNNCTWEVTPGDVISHPQNKIKRHVWEKDIIRHNVRRVDPAFRIEKGKDEHGKWTFDIKVSEKHKSNCFRMLINASRIFWRNEFESETMSKEEQEEYRKKYRFTIDGPALSEEDAAEQKQHLVNKIFALGYLLHNYKIDHRAVCVYAIDNKESSQEESHGGSGKSFFCKLPRLFHEQVEISGRNSRLDESAHIFENVTENSRSILVDDCNQYTPFGFFFDKITSMLNVNPKHTQSFNIPFETAPKIIISSNYAVRNMDPSTVRRILFCVFSDYYHQKTPENDYLESRTIYDDFRKDLFREDYTEEEWNADINFMMDCCRFYLSTLSDNILIEPPMQNVIRRNLRAEMTESFLEWATTYFAPVSGNCDCLLPFSDVFDEYKIQTGQYKITAHSFSKALNTYCRYDDTIIALNPKPLQNSQKRIIRKKNDKATSFLYVQRKHELFEDARYEISKESNPASIVSDSDAVFPF
jgi:hypothetical protein